MRSSSRLFLLAIAATGLLTNVAGRAISTGDELLEGQQGVTPSSEFEKRVLLSVRAANPVSPAATDEACPAGQKLTARGCNQSKNMITNDDTNTGTNAATDDDFLAGLPAETIQTSATKGSEAKAQADARKLLAAQKVEKTYPSWTLSYQPKRESNFVKGKLPAEMQTNLGTVLEAHGVNIAADAELFTANPIGTPPKEKPVLRAYYLSNAIIVTDAFADSDSNTGAKRLYSSELIFQGAEQAQSRPAIVVSYTIVNDDTIRFANTALKGAASVTVTAGNAATNANFEQLLGSDNGRGVQQMLNDHPTYFGRKSVVAIQVVKHAGSEFPTLIFVIG